jgi:magnesium transporter
VTSFLVARDGMLTAHIDRAHLEPRLGAGEFFWLDLHSPGEDEYAILRDVFKFHPLAVEDSQHFGQRAKVEDYGEFVFLVVFGAAPPPDEDRLVEVHCFYSDRFLVTVRQDEAPACDALRKRYEKRPAPPPRPIVLLYRLLDALTDSFFPALQDFDERIDQLLDLMLDSPSSEQMGEIFRMRRRLVSLRRAVSPQRDLVAAFASGRAELPDMDEEAERYFRDVYDHLVRLSDMIDSYRDLLTGATDVYLSTVSNRLNLVMKRLTVIATIALPLIVISGFFGQNFGFMVDHIAGWPAFVGLAIALPLAFIAALMVYLRRKGLL